MKLLYACIKLAEAMTKRRTLLKTILSNILYLVAALAVVLIVWVIVATVKDLPLLFPSLSAIFTSLWEMLGESDTWVAIGGTLGRIMASFMLSLVFGIALGIAGTFFKPLYKFLRPIVTVLQAFPTMAVILLAVVWLDRTEVPLLVGFLVCFPLIYSASYTALTHIDTELLEMASIYKMRPVDKLKGICFPAATPPIIDGARSAVTLCVKVVIAAEVLAQTRRSIGLAMQMNSIWFEIDELLAWTIVAVILSFLLEGIILGIKKLLELKR